jgi:hypothetical protein
MELPLPPSLNEPSLACAVGWSEGTPATPCRLGEGVEGCAEGDEVTGGREGALEEGAAVGSPEGWEEGDRDRLGSPVGVSTLRA